VDFLLGGGEVAIEVKGLHRVPGSALHGLSAFLDEHAPSKALVVCNESEPRVTGKVRILPWRVFLRELWEDNIIR
jgi:hypothetical protein